MAPDEASEAIGPARGPGLDRKTLEVAAQVVAELARIGVATIGIRFDGPANDPVQVTLQLPPMAGGARHAAEPCGGRPVRREWASIALQPSTDQGR